MKKSKENFNSRLIKASGIKPVAYNPMLARVADRSPDAGLFMSQLLYWWDKGWKSGMIYKTIKEIENETCLSRTKQDRAIRIWKRLGILTVTYHKVPRKRHFQIDVERLIGMLERMSGARIVLERAFSVMDFDTLFVDSPQSITESTPERYVQR